MRIALCQIRINYEKIEENLSRAEALIFKSAEKQSEVILFPEMSFSGFSMNVEAIGRYSEIIIEKMRDCAQSHRIYVGFGWVKAKGCKGENHYSVISPDGQMIYDYIKIHPFTYGGENMYYEGGKAVRLGYIEENPISVFICYDLRFPEIFQLVSDKAAFIIVAANWPKERRGHWLTLLRARAIENQVYILGINCTGEQRGVAYSGDSIVFRPDGEIVQGAPIGEEILFYDLENDVNDYRMSFPVKNDRRDELYYSLYNKINL